MDPQKGFESSGSGQDKSKAPPDKENVNSRIPSHNNCDSALQKQIDEPQLPTGQEPISESRNGSASSPGRSSPDAVCAVCLGPFQDKAFADTCFHPFCFDCIVEWSKVKPECPLCKQTFSSIVHNVRSMEDYDQYYIVSKSSQSSWHSADGRRFRYSSTLTSERFVERQSLSALAEIDRQSEFARHRLLYAPHSFRTNAPMPPIMFPETRVSTERQRIYATGLWSNKPSGRVRIRSTSPAFYQENPACTHRLIPWLNRELLALLHGSETRVMFVLDLILSLIMRYEIRSEEFHLHLEPYLEGQTRHFVHEFFNYASSPFDMDAYDRSVTYDTPSTCDDAIIVSSPVCSIVSDVVQLSSSDTSRPTTSSRPRKKKSKKRGKHLTKLYLRRNQESDSWNVLPSTSALDCSAFLFTDFPNYDLSFGSGPSTSHCNNTVLVPSTPPSPIVLGDSSDECEIVQCVKPRNLRTPEIVDLISDNEGHGAAPNEESINIADVVNELILSTSRLSEILESHSSLEREYQEASSLSRNDEPAPSINDDVNNDCNGTDPSLPSLSHECGYAERWSPMQTGSNDTPIPGSTYMDQYDDSTDVSDCNTDDSRLPQENNYRKTPRLNSVVCSVSSEKNLNAKASSSHSVCRKTHKSKHKKKHEKHRHKHHKSRSHSKERK